MTEKVGIQMKMTGIPQWVSSDGTKFTYRASVSAITPAATPKSIFQLVPGTATVRIKRYRVSGFATTAGFMPYRVERRSSANTGSKENAITVGQHDSADPATTVTSVSYYNTSNGNPTAEGTVVAVLDAGRVAFPSVTVGLGAGFDGGCDESMCQAMDKAMIFRGATDIFDITLTGAAVPSGGVYDLMVEWEEDYS